MLASVLENWASQALLAVMEINWSNNSGGIYDDIYVKIVKCMPFDLEM